MMYGHLNIKYEWPLKPHKKFTICELLQDPTTRTTHMSPLYSRNRPIWLLGTYQHNAVPVSGNILQNYVWTTNFKRVVCPFHMKHYMDPHGLQFRHPTPTSANRDLGDHGIVPQRKQTPPW